MNLFGRKKAAPVQPNPAQTIMKLKGTLDSIDKREMHLSKRIEQELLEAKKKLATKDKRGALFCMKKKKMYEKEVEKLQGARLNLEYEIMHLESSQINMELFSSMKTGAAQMKAVHQNMDADKIDQIMDDVQEEMAVADEISEAISRPISNDLHDEDELLAELEEETLEELEAVPQKITAPAAAAAAPAKVAAAAALDFPDPPQHRPTAIKVAGDVDDEELRALRELEAQMAL